MRFVAGRDAVAERLAGALMRMAGAHRCVMAVRAVAQKHRVEASGKRVPGYFCLGGALRGYILSITSIGTPRIRCSCLFVAE